MIRQKSNILFRQSLWELNGKVKFFCGAHTTPIDGRCREQS